MSSIQSLSFWQQDQAFWSQAQSQAQASASSTSLITTMGSAVTNEAKGLASIANQTALARVQAQLTAALQSAVQASQQSSASTSSSSTTGAPATGTGTVPLSATTALFTLGVIQGGTITVSDGTNTTTYTSTGTDTVGDLINAINNPNIATNAQVRASLSAGGQLSLTGTNDNVSISVGGLYASNIGFGPNNASFQPTAPASSTASSPATSGSSNSSSAASSPGAGSSTTSAAAPAGTSTASLFNSSYLLQTGGTAETLLASSGLSGSLVNLLA